MTTKTVSHIDRIVRDPAVLAGKPTVRGTRIPVELVLKRLSQDLDVPALYRAYPRLKPKDVQACLEYVASEPAAPISTTLEGAKPC
ncbi:MAG: DUF433 domain-containing protein [Dehalococcoidia bacterium]|nr:DUF433 domain-containing protein [Dehalococcoidia bacterium]